MIATVKCLFVKFQEWSVDDASYQCHRRSIKIWIESNKSNPVVFWLKYILKKGQLVKKAYVNVLFDFVLVLSFALRISIKIYIKCNIFFCLVFHLHPRTLILFQLNSCSFLEKKICHVMYDHCKYFLTWYNLTYFLYMK